MDLKKLFVQHGEKIGLGAAILILVLVVVKTSVMPPEDTDVGSANQLADELDRRLNEDQPPKAELQDYVARNTSMWQTVTAAKGGNTWAVYKAPIAKADVKTRERATVKYLYAPIVREPKLALGKVTVEWEADKKTTAAVSGYKVFRKGPQGDWQPLTETAITDTSFTDNKVEPKKKYSYKVSAETKEPTATTKVVESDVREATTLGVKQIIFRGGTEQMAQILVRKLDSAQEKMFFVKVGDKIGDIVAIDIKGTKVDFGTGYVLNAIKKEKRKYVRMETVKEWTGSTYVEKEVEKEDFKTELKIYYTDDDGKACEMWAETDSKPEPKKPTTPPKEPEKPAEEKKPDEKKDEGK
ncbi:MAG: fibronectin type III domain-containing protein [Planctomycetota bacterium]|nr:fibronectin type III domain-containing protein [Planctomycetota bacterium]